jgi:hypothetical protein
MIMETSVKSDASENGIIIALNIVRRKFEGGLEL